MTSLSSMTPFELRDSGRRDAIPELIRRLSSETNAERCQASTALNHFATLFPDDVAHAIPALLEMAVDSFYPARRHALKSLRVLSDALSENDRRRIAELASSEVRDANRKLIDEIISHPPGQLVSQRRGGNRAADDTPQGSGLRVGIGHLFASGGNLSYDKVFHVGGVRLSRDEPPQYQDWIIDSGRRITKRLYEKSQVTNAQSESSARWSDRRHDIQRFFGELDVLFVFSLYQEQRWFTEFVLSGVEDPPIVIDLQSLARFFVPDRTFYDLDELISRAVPDNEWNMRKPRLPYGLRGLTALLDDLIKTIVAPSSDSDSTPFVLSLLAHALDEEGHPDFKVIFEVVKAGPFRFSDQLPTVAARPEAAVVLPDVTYVIEAVKIALPPAPNGNVPETANPENDATSPLRRLRPDGVAEAFGHYEKKKIIHRRDLQREYATFVTQAIGAPGRFAIEAGTGTGKTLGYLVPALEFVRLNPGYKVVIATATKNLQAQIIDNELGRVTRHGTLFQDAAAAILKGKGNYICLTALADKYEELFVYNRSNHEEADRLAWIHCAILCLRAEGDLEMEGISDRFQRAFLNLRDDINAHASCTRDLCDNGLKCLYPRVSERARTADVVITNHHKLGYIQSDITDHATICIIDEADQFPDNFRGSAETELSRNELILRYLNRLVLKSKERRGFLQLALDDFERRAQKSKSDVATLQTAIRHCQSGISAAERIGEVSYIIGQTCSKLKAQEIRWQKPQSSGVASRLSDALAQLALSLSEMERALEGLIALKENDAFITRRYRQIQRYIDQTKELRKKAIAIPLDYPSADYVHIAGLTDSTKPGRWILRKVPMNLATALEESVYGRFPVTIYTSATLYVDDTLDLFRQELSLQADFDAEMRIDSPFDFEKNVLGSVSSAITPFNHRAERQEAADWRSQIAEAIVQLVGPLYGRSLVLLTNTKEMNAIYELVRSRLEDSDIEVLIQNGSSPLQISTFRKVEYSVLFGVDRFWTGVDFPGPTLSQVIVVRMPNPHLGDPLVERRKHYLRKFWDAYYEPVARLKLRQGFGRLIRESSDRGLFVTLDSRVANDRRYKSYERELPVPLQRVHDIGRKGVELTEFTDRGLRHVGLMTEYQERQSYMMPAEPDVDPLFPL
jgi:ATP-dependent DNA helicase DinG